MRHWRAIFRTDDGQAYFAVDVVAPRAWQATAAAKAIASAAPEWGRLVLVKLVPCTPREARVPGALWRVGR